MSEENTQSLADGRSFEERVFARFDAMDARFDAVDARLDALDARVGALEEQNERRALETKPIWERALAEILEVKERVGLWRRSRISWCVRSTCLAGTCSPCVRTRRGSKTAWTSSNPAPRRSLVIVSGS